MSNCRHDSIAIERVTVLSGTIRPEDNGHDIYTVACKSCGTEITYRDDEIPYDLANDIYAIRAHIARKFAVDHARSNTPQKSPRIIWHSQPAPEAAALPTRIHWADVQPPRVTALDALSKSIQSGAPAFQVVHWDRCRITEAGACSVAAFIRIVDKALHPYIRQGDPELLRFFFAVAGCTPAGIYGQVHWLEPVYDFPSEVLRIFQDGYIDNWPSHNKEVELGKNRKPKHKKPGYRIFKNTSGDVIPLPAGPEDKRGGQQKPDRKRRQATDRAGDYA